MAAARDDFGRTCSGIDDAMSAKTLLTTEYPEKISLATIENKFYSLDVGAGWEARSGFSEEAARESGRSARDRE
ncbi:hypothetical protein ACFS2C_18890 [Prauserella oleivorans]|uniref:Uncharacterized protein n=1 Tax=Prauserella oleivorans TaxID=1478153 RepID=A0ABW5WGF7_9PSEU